MRHRVSPMLLPALVLLTACGGRDSSRDAAVDSTAVDSGPADGSADAADAGVDATDADATPDAAVDGCEVFSPAARAGAVESTSLGEISGLAASRAHAGVLYVHNDSGEPRARFFAIGEDGRDLGEYTLLGADFRDWEDMAAGPGPDGPSLYFGDIGDNAARDGFGAPRSEVQVYRVAEPSAAPSGPGVSELGGAERFVFTYPDGPHDAESLFVDPGDSALYIISKESDGVSGVFRASAPLVADSTTALERVATIRFGTASAPGNVQSTAADISASGDRILGRTYTSVLLWPRAPGQSVADALSADALELPQRAEMQGEAIGFTRGDGAYVTISEGGTPPVWRFDAACDAP